MEKIYKILTRDVDLRVVGECARRKAACNRVAASVLAELEDGTLSVFICRDCVNIGRVVDGHNCPSSCQELLPRPFKVDNT